MEDIAERDNWWHKRESEENQKWYPQGDDRRWDGQVEELAWVQEWFIIVIKGKEIHLSTDSGRMIYLMIGFLEILF